MLMFSKIRDVKSPSRGTSGSAGIDFYVPANSVEFRSAIISKNLTSSYEFWNDCNAIVVQPNRSILIPSGIKVHVPKDFALVAFNKSGICVNTGFSVGACVVDSDYQGEVHIHLINTTKDIAKIKFNEKAVQFLLVPVDHSAPIEVPLDELYGGKITERGEGGFSSTGLK